MNLKDNLAIEFLKMKGFYTQETLTDTEMQSYLIVEKIVDYFKTAKPLVDYLNVAIND